MLCVAGAGGGDGGGLRSGSDRAQCCSGGGQCGVKRHEARQAPACLLGHGVAAGAQGDGSALLVRGLRSSRRGGGRRRGAGATLRQS